MPHSTPVDDTESEAQSRLALGLAMADGSAEAGGTVSANSLHKLVDPIVAPQQIPRPSAEVSMPHVVNMPAERDVTLALPKRHSPTTGAGVADQAVSEARPSWPSDPRPKHCATPEVSTAQECCAPQASERKREPESTRAAKGAMKAGAVPPTPHCPLAQSPQHRSSPFVESAQAWKPPAATVAKSRGAPVTRTGTATLRIRPGDPAAEDAFPSPSWPKAPSPQQTSACAAVTPQLNW